MLSALLRTLETSDVTLCHGSLRDPLWEYVTNPRSAAASLALAKTSHCCAGHTHVPSLWQQPEQLKRQLCCGVIDDGCGLFIVPEEG